MVLRFDIIKQSDFKATVKQSDCTKKIKSANLMPPKPPFQSALV